MRNFTRRLQDLEEGARAIPASAKHGPRPITMYEVKSEADIPALGIDDAKEQAVVWVMPGDDETTQEVERD